MRNQRRSHSNNRSSKRSAKSFVRLVNADARRRTDAGGERFVELALRYLDYKPRPGGLTDFGKRTGYNGHDIPWSGSFVDCVARDAGILMPACVYTPSGLAEFIFAKRWRAEPRVGDIVFYSFSTKQTDPFSMPHIGIVVDVNNWAASDSFIAIEGQVDGTVKLMTRWKYETVGFGRPDFKNRRAETAASHKIKPVELDYAKVRPGLRGKHVLNVQIALSRTAGLSGQEPAVFDVATQRAYARWQRMIGFVGTDANGVPNKPSLDRLGEVTGVFVQRREEL